MKGGRICILHWLMFIELYTYSWANNFCWPFESRNYNVLFPRLLNSIPLCVRYMVDMFKLYNLFIPEFQP